MKRVLITCTAIAAVGLALAARGNGDTLTAHIDAAHSDLAKAQAPIPHQQLHAHALEILRSITQAADDEVVVRCYRTRRGRSLRCLREGTDGSGQLRQVNQLQGATEMKRLLTAAAIALLMTTAAQARTTNLIRSGVWAADLS